MNEQLRTDLGERPLEGGEPLSAPSISSEDNGRPVRVTQVTPGYWRVTFDNPPINLFDPDTFAALRLLLERIETDENVRVLVFGTADPDYYISHLDVERVFEVPDIQGAANLADEWHHFVTRLAHSPVLSIASIRGRVRGIGNEFVLACDMRLASEASVPCWKASPHMARAGLLEPQLSDLA